jgi:predicted Fe-S protein YdhL (DUF1289 family)
LFLELTSKIMTLPPLKSSFALLALTMVISCGAALADQGRLGDRQAAWESMSPEERDAARERFQRRSGSDFQGLTPEQRREKWEQMSPEQRQALKERLPEREGPGFRAMSPDERRARWEQMSPDERATAISNARKRFDALPPEKQAEVRRRLEDQKSLSDPGQR